MHRSLQEAVNQRRKTRNINNDTRIINSYERRQLSVLNPDFHRQQDLNVTDNLDVSQNNATPAGGQSIDKKRLSHAVRPP